MDAKRIELLTERCEDVVNLFIELRRDADEKTRRAMDNRYLKALTSLEKCIRDHRPWLDQEVERVYDMEKGALSDR